MATETETAGTLIPRDSLANRLVLIRRELGLSQREAAMRCGVGFGSWQSWENGGSPRNELRKLSQVAEELHVDRDWLLFGGQLRAEEWGDDTSRSDPQRPHCGTERPGYAPVHNEVTALAKPIGSSDEELRARLTSGIPVSSVLGSGQVVNS